MREKFLNYVLDERLIKITEMLVLLHSQAKTKVQAMHKTLFIID